MHVHIYPLTVVFQKPQNELSSVKKNKKNSYGFNGYDGNCSGFIRNSKGVYWYVIDSVGGFLE